MILVFDSGNSNIKVGIFKSNRLVFTFRLSNNKTLKQYYNTIKKNLKKINKITINEIEGIAISSVVPEIKKKLIELSQKYFFIKPVLITKKTKVNFINLYKNKKKLGEDRIANLVAAESLYKAKNKIIIDYGTAITIDVLDYKGRFLGGVIMPGLGLILRSLHKNTAQLPFINKKFTSVFLGKKTDECILAGLKAISIGSIKYLISGIKEYLMSKDIIIILTGGDASKLIAKRLDESRIIIKKSLCLLGMKKIYDMNIK